MRDEYEDRLWAEHHQAFTTQIIDLFDKLRDVFEYLRAYRFHAPWERKERPQRDGRRCPS